ncbi:MAG TPA: type II toxin-antitoxin system VapC family toxin [Solirubrobacteraceae bacterium]|nr:type II toxin-antitoxin system VapC family toxin [Solirubrobacteraceae bacterium]
MAETERRPKGLLDTSVVIDLESLDPVDLPVELAVSAVTMAELATGPEATRDPEERARRIGLIQHAEDTFDQLPLDIAAARVYGRVYAAVTAAGRKARGRRTLDLLIAAVALSNELPLYTHNVGDFVGLEELIDVVAVPYPDAPDAPHTLPAPAGAGGDQPADPPEDRP